MIRVNDQYRLCFVLLNLQEVRYELGQARLSIGLGDRNEFLHALCSPMLSIV